MKTLSVFIGTAVKGNHKGFYSAFLHIDDKSLSVPAREITEEYTDEYELILLSISDVLSSLSGCLNLIDRIVFYTESDRITNGYERYLKGESVIFKNMWDGIREKASEKELIFYGENSILLEVSHLRSKKLKNKR